MLALNMMATQVPLDAPWTGARGAEWDAQTSETWIRATSRSDEARELMSW